MKIRKFRPIQIVIVSEALVAAASLYSIPSLAITTRELYQSSLPIYQGSIPVHQGKVPFMASNLGVFILLIPVLLFIIDLVLVMALRRFASERIFFIRHAFYLVLMGASFLYAFKPLNVILYPIGVSSHY